MDIISALKKKISNNILTVLLESLSLEPLIEIERAISIQLLTQIQTTLFPSAKEILKMANSVGIFETLITKASVRSVSGSRIPQLRNGTFQFLDHMENLFITTKMDHSKLKKDCTWAMISAGIIFFNQWRSMIILKITVQLNLESISKWLRVRENDFD